MLGWANQFNICCFLDNNKYSDKFHSYEWLLAAGASKIFSPQKNIFQALYNLYETNNDWLFGHLGYDLKNEVEKLSSSHIDCVGFPDIILFQPEIVLRSSKDKVIISCLNVDPAKILDAIRSQEINTKNSASKIFIQSRIS